MSSRSRLLADLAALFRDWWRNDAVRCSPREGRLLRIAVHSVIAVGGETAVVRSREVCRSPNGSVVRYYCGPVADRTRLVLEVRPERRDALWIVDACNGESVPVEEVEVYPPALRG